MIEIRTWRDLLRKIIIDSQEGKRIAKELGVYPTTLYRWTAGTSNPRPHNIKALLKAVHQYQKELSELVAKEYPLLVDAENIFASEKEEIAGSFYSQALSTYTASPASLRGSALRLLVLQHIVRQFSKINSGIEIVIVELVTPNDRVQKIRSLRITEGRGNPPFASTYELKPVLIGIESLAGSAIMHCKTFATQNKEELELQFPSDVIKGSYTVSMTACPILLADSLAGCIVASSSVENFFLPFRIDILKSYVDLLTLTFNNEDFYNRSSIELATMPDKKTQDTVLAKFQQRVTCIIMDSDDREIVLSRSEAEKIAWKQVEEEILASSIFTQRLC